MGIAFVEKGGAKLLAEQTNRFADPKHHRGAGDEDRPVAERQRSHVEHLAAEGDNDDLPDQDHQQDEQKALALLEVEGRLSREISAGIEHVPELEHHEEREDVAFLQSREPHSRAELQVAQIGERSHIGMLADIDKAKQEEEEEATDDENHALHATIDDEGIAIAGLVADSPRVVR